MKKGINRAAKFTSYAVLSSVVFASLVGSPAIVAHADLQLTGDTKITGKLVITKQVDIKDQTSGALKNTKVIINPADESAAIDLKDLVINDIEIQNSVNLKGTKLENATIVINPVNADSKIDLSGAKPNNIFIKNNNVTQIIVPDGVEKIEVANGVNTDNLEVFDKTGESIDVDFVLEPFTLSIMHTNDTHSNLANAPKTVTAVKNIRTEKPNALLLNAGDVFSGTLYFNEFKGKADLEVMNLMGYDAMTFGNHEFDLGKSPEGHQALVNFIKGAQFPFVSSNVDFTADEKFTGLFSDSISSEPDKGKIYNGIVKEINGKKVGIFGLTTADTKNIASPEAVTFEDYKEEAEKAVKAFEDMDVDKIIAITHIGYDDNAAVDNDLTLAAEVEGIDIIVGGHTHTALEEPVVVDEDGTPTVIVQSGANNSNLGVLDVEFNEDGLVVNHNGELIAIKEQADDKEALEKLSPYKEQVDALAKEEIGVSTSIDLELPRTNGDNTKPSVRKNEIILGNLITDGMLSKARKFTGKSVIMALQNGGGIRSAIDAGPITVGEVISVLPFGNTLSVMEVKGAEIKAAFEHSLKELPAENGGFLHVSGAKVEYDSSKPAGERVVSIKYKDATEEYVEIQDKENYTVATNAYTAMGGDKFTMFKVAYDEGRVTDLGLSDWENFRDHLKSLTKIPTDIEGRIVDVAGQQNPETELPSGEYRGDEFSGTAEKPKVYAGDVTVSVAEINKLENAVVKGNLTIKGTVTGEVTLSNITVEGNLDYTDLEASSYNLNGITVEGDTIS
ncbi:MAG: 5'-nucleotidase C-terminal domain-containing protein [Psychrobacillus psychrodurans]